uniref:Uncharacterized protein n=1 Tax=Tanacetum cinerariifolium TaxID=118510 RepID=A0A6L2MYF3_TANCI|nr:hypothetical protein [Tanacetum cinerariifolium]
MTVVAWRHDKESVFSHRGHGYPFVVEKRLVSWRDNTIKNVFAGTPSFDTLLSMLYSSKDEMSHKEEHQPKKAEANQKRNTKELQKEGALRRKVFLFPLDSCCFEVDAAEDFKENTLRD